MKQIYLILRLDHSTGDEYILGYTRYELDASDKIVQLSRNLARVIKEKERIEFEADSKHDIPLEKRVELYKRGIKALDLSFDSTLSLEDLPDDISDISYFYREVDHL